MKSITKKRLATALCVYFALLPIGNLAMAWGWGSIIRPGSHVFDAKRYADSVKIFTQTQQQVANQLERYEKMIIASSRILGVEQGIIDKITSFSDKYLGTTIINPDHQLENATASGDTLYKTTIGSDEGYKNYMFKLNEEFITANGDTLNVFQNAQRNYNAKMSELSDLQNVRTGEGNLGSNVGEYQKSTYAKGLEASADIESARMQGAAMAQRIQEQQHDLVAEQAERAHGSAINLPAGFDPYNPTPEQQTHQAEVSKDLGFGTFTGGLGD